MDQETNSKRTQPVKPGGRLNRLLASPVRLILTVVAVGILGGAVAIGISILAEGSNERCQKQLKQARVDSLLGRPIDVTSSCEDYVYDHTH